MPRGGEAGGERLRAAGRDRGAARSRAAGGVASCREGSGRCRDCRPGTRRPVRVSLFTSPPKALARGGPAAAALCKRPGGWDGAGPRRDGTRRAASRPGAGRCAVQGWRCGSSPRRRAALGESPSGRPAGCGAGGLCGGVLFSALGLCFGLKERADNTNGLRFRVLDLPGTNKTSLD